jgi:hypothetical protein
MVRRATKRAGFAKACQGTWFGVSAAREQGHAWRSKHVTSFKGFAGTQTVKRRQPGRLRVGVTSMILLLGGDFSGERSVF